MKNRKSSTSSIHSVIKKDPRKAARTSKALYQDIDEFGDDFDIKLQGDPGDTDHYLSMFPELIRAAEIMIATTLSPKDLSTMTLNHKLCSDRLPNHVISDALSRITDVLEDEYHIKEILQNAAREFLIGKGALVKVIIPEGVIDKLIQNSSITTESINYVMNQLSSNTLGKEKKKKKNDPLQPITDYISITDEPSLLRLPEVTEAKMSTESLSDQYNHIMKRDGVSNKKALYLSNQYRSRRDLEKPFILTVDPFACKVISSPNDPSNHIAIVLLLDKNGYPIVKPPPYVSTSEMDRRFKESGLQRNSIVTLKEFKKEEEDATNEDLFKRYLSKHIISRMNDGLFNVDEDIDIDTITHTALARALNKLETRILVLPANMMEYFAVKYDCNGKGVNRLKDLSVLLGMRGLLLFSALGNSVANNSTQTRVNVELDPNAGDINKEMKTIKRIFMNMNDVKLPMNLSDPKDFIKWQRRSGVTFHFTGHPGLPKTTIDIENDTRSRPSDTDTVLMEEVRKQLLLAMGPGAEIVDNGFDANHAVTSESNRILLGKQNEQFKIPLLRQGISFAKKVLMAHGPMFKDLEDSLSNNDAVRELYEREKKELEKMMEEFEEEEKKKANAVEDPKAKKEEEEGVEVPVEDDDEDYRIFVNELIIDLINSYTMTVPESSIGDKINMLNDELGDFISWLDNALPAWIDQDMQIDDGDMRATFDAYRAYFIREFISNHKAAADLGKILQVDRLGKPILNILEDINKHVSLIKGIAKEYDPPEKEEDPEPTQEPPQEPSQDDDNIDEGEGIDDDDDFNY